MRQTMIFKLFFGWVSWVFRYPYWRCFGWLCCDVFSNATHTKSIIGRFCLGAPVCPCAPTCKGKDKLPPYCNKTSAAGYRLDVQGGDGTPSDGTAIPP